MPGVSGDCPSLRTAHPPEKRETRPRGNFAEQRGLFIAWEALCPLLAPPTAAANPNWSDMALLVHQTPPPEGLNSAQGSVGIQLQDQQQQIQRQTQHQNSYQAQRLQQNQQQTQLRRRSFENVAKRGGNMESCALLRLPESVLERILAQTTWKDVEAARCTCRTLQRVCDEQVTEISARMAISPTAWTRISELAPRLKALSLRECRSISEATLAGALASCVNLREIRLQGIMFGEEAAKAVLQANPPLEALELSGMIVCGETLLTKIIQQQGKNLKSLQLGNSIDMGRKLVRTLMETCESLKNLELFECPLLDVFELASTRPLEVLSLRSCRLERVRVRRTPEEVENQLKPLTQLKALDLRFNYWLDFSQLKFLTRYTPLLRRIWLSGSCTPNGLATTLELTDLPFLQEIDLEACAALTSVKIARCPELCKLDVGSCDRLQEIHIEEVRNLQVLDLSLLVDLEELSLRAIPRLRYVNLCGCYKLNINSGVSMQDIPATCKLLQARQFAI